MEVKNPSELFAFLVTANESKRLGRDISFVRKIRPRFCEGLDLGLTYETSRKAAIILRTSVSLSEVSSNPGVSIKTTRRPSRSKASAG